MITGALLICRIGAFVALSPFPAHFTTPSQRIGLAVILSLSLIFSVDTRSAPTALDLRMTVPVLREVLCGALMGIAHRIVFLAADVLGTSVSASMGLTMPQVMDPHTEAHESALGRLFTLLGMLVLVSSGVHRMAFAHLLRSFDAVPLGSAHGAHLAAPLLISLAGDSLSAGVSLAMPVAGVTLVLQLALAMVARSSPQLQLFNVGLGLMMLAGIVTCAGGARDMLEGLGAHFQLTARTWDVGHP